MEGLTYFALGWVLIGMGVVGLAAGEIYMAVRRKQIKEELRKIQEEG